MLNRTKRPRDAAFNAFSVIEGDKAATLGDQIDQTLECSFNGVEVFVNIGVIEFD